MRSPSLQGRPNPSLQQTAAVMLLLDSTVELRPPLLSLLFGEGIAMTRAAVIPSTVLVLLACAPSTPSPSASTPDSPQIPVSTTVAPIPKDASNSLYFPSRVGTRWVYQQSWGDDYVQTVTAVEEKDGNISSQLLPHLSTTLTASKLGLPSISCQKRACSVPLLL